MAKSDGGRQTTDGSLAVNRPPSDLERHSTLTDFRLGIGIIGAGNIAGPYAKDLSTYPELELRGVTDLLPERAQQFAAEHNCHAYASMDDLLADDAVQLVVNLTIFDAHKDVTTRALDASKHVYSEKPLALNSADAHALVAHARAKHLRLGCSPMVFMGEAQQTAWKWIRDGRLGAVRVAFADAHNGRIETWHPAPEPFYKAGILFDVGVYPLTILTTILGLARRVWAHGKVLKPERVTKSGAPFHVDLPEFVSLDLEMANGTLVKLATSYYVSSKTRQAYAIQFHGDLGTLNLSNWMSFGADVEFAPFDKPFESVPLVRDAERGVRWGRGVLDMALAIAEDRPHRATGEQAAHVVDIVCAATEAMQSNRAVEITSSFAPPAPMEWAETTDD